MPKIICIWGNSGSGKSVFCCILARLLTKNKQKAIIINAGSDLPMLPVWLPDRNIETSCSIGQALSALKMDTGLVASHIAVVKSHPYIGLMGYAANENPLSYPEVKYESAKDLIYTAEKLVDYVILDCTSNMNNLFTPAAMECADIVIRILTPDLRGIHYLKAHQPLLTDQRFHFEEHMTFAGQARPFHAIDEMGHIIGGFDGILPYSKEIDRCMTSGEMFDALNYCHTKYMDSLKKIMEVLHDGYAQQIE